MTCGVYEIQNTVNGKSYIGSSQNIEKRWKCHLNSLRSDKHHSKHLQRAWNIDGEDAFSFEIVLICDKSNLLMYEQAIMSFYMAAESFRGYNTSAVAGSRRGVPHSEEVRAKMREAAKNRPPKSEKYRAEQSARMKKKIEAGEFFSEEHRRRISEGQRGKKKSPESVEKTRLSNLGRSPSEETREKLRLANSGRKLSAENYAKLLERSKTTNLITPEIRAKMAKSLRDTHTNNRAAIADTIVRLRKSGMTYKMVADRLTEDGVPTLRKALNANAKSGNVWHSMIVRTIWLEATQDL